MIMRLKKKAIYFILSVGIIGFLTYLVIPMDPGSYRNYSQVILARDSSFLRVYLNQEEQWCLPPSLQEVIPDKLRIAVIEYEDQYFYYHPGINPVAIFRAAYLNIKRKKIVSGGSTISMQLARMRNNQERSFINKLKETFVAFKYEFHYSKDEILAEYLSHAPYGSNVRGYLAASHRFFGKKPHQLTWGEAATLAMDIGYTELLQDDGIDKLTKAIQNRVFPHAHAEAKDLYRIGHKQHGMLSRQPKEAMTNFVARRRRWWKLLKSLDSSIEISETIRGDLLLESCCIVSGHCGGVLGSCCRVVGELLAN